MVTLKHCPICNSPLFREYHVMSVGDLIIELIPGVKIDGQIVIRYCVCQNCHLIFQNPRLSDSELDKYYGTGLYRRTINPPPEGMDKDAENRANIDAKIIIETIGNVKSHLDVGCGLGYLLEMVGADIRVGVESDTEYVKFKNVKVFPELSKVTPKKFDLVSSVHVLEHVPYPAAYLKNMTKHIKSDGFFVVEVPSLKTQGGPLGFAHLSYFEPDVLKLMCRGAGLNVIRTEFTPHLLLICKLSRD